MEHQEQVRLSQDRPILYYDGQCLLCDGFVNFLIKNDKKKQFLFCALQHQSSTEVRKKLNMTNEIKTVALLYRGKLYTESDVSFQIIKIIGGAWVLLLPLIIVPKSIRNQVYRWVAENRYKWFGKSDQCIIPDQSIKERFI